MIVRGVVQGVGFRYYVYRLAQHYSLVGFVRNQVDGNLEILAEGPRSLIESLIADVKVGPRSAHVTDVQLSWREAEGKFTSFVIG